MREAKIPITWSHATVGDITESVSKVQPRLKPNLKIHYLDISGIDNYSNKVVETKEYMGKNAPSRARQLVKEGDVLFSTVRTYLKNIAKVPPKFDGEIASTGFSILRATPAVHPDYLFAFTLFPKFLEPLAELQRGSSYPAVRDSDVRSQPIPLPPLAEQKRIVAKIEELFSELDAGVDSFKQARKQLGLYRQSLLQQAFCGKLTEAWRAANPDLLEDPEELLARVLQERRAKWQGKWKTPREPTSDSSDLPDTWARVTVDQIMVEPMCNGLSLKGTDEPPGVAALKLNAMAGETIDYSPRRYLQTDSPKVDRIWIREGDFFVCRGNGSVKLVGRGCRAGKPPDKVIFPDTMIRLRFAEDIRQSGWCATIWNADVLRYEIERRAKTTSGLYKISQGDIASIEIPLPSLPEQNEIVHLLESQFAAIEQNEREIDAALKRADALRQSILKKAFSGQLVPQDPNDEPAGELLARIREERAVTQTKTKAKRKSPTKKAASVRARR